MSSNKNSPNSLFDDPDFRQFLANSVVQLIAAAASIFAYYFFGGLFSAIVSQLIILPTLLIMLKAAGYKIEPLQYVALFFLVVLGLPAILLDNSFMAKIQEPISGLVAGLSFSALSLYFKEPLIKNFIPAFFRKLDAMQPLFSKTDSAWKKIDYLWAAEMTLSAALSMAAVFLFSTDIWFIAKNTIGPVLTIISMGITGKILFTDPGKPLVLTPEVRDTYAVLEPSHENTEPRQSPSLMTIDYQSKVSEVNGIMYGIEVTDTSSQHAVSPS